MQTANHGRTYTDLDTTNKQAQQNIYNTINSIEPQTTTLYIPSQQNVKPQKIKRDQPGHIVHIYRFTVILSHI